MNNNEFELRSEKVRSIIGKIPPLLLRVGIGVITCVVAIALCLMYYIPYPQTQSVSIQVSSANSAYTAHGELNVANAQSISVGQTARVQITSLSGNYYVQGKVTSLSEQAGKAHISIALNPQLSTLPHLNTKPIGNAEVLISDTPLLRRVVQ